ncbi:MULTISPECIES: universal stress protein [unclassified Gemella]|uniref:universal stress protein n=1 Tax=unclassified Gemella TaxID=2624949 RepID=UPI001072FC7D|nr:MULTISPECIES: universal stress protein [unclassified Gemella]MBF0709641.1 universal stress protein [Gemella sp. GL1.1]MBF0746940.1 universal stress protein [Gemella sp. 19428wG2_WT2a]NYS26985.1 universal stress protein [Gemella sp. GL1]TFU59166.1 universal stress protein [Gemella sp. WT2a]
MENKYTRILVAIDGSKQAEWAFHNALAIAKRNNNAELYIASVIDQTLSLSASPSSSIFKDYKDRIENFVDTYAAYAKADGLTTVVPIVEYGSPKLVLSEKIVNDFGIDLVVCASSGLSGFKRFVLGSVSEGIARYSKVDVIIIKEKSMPADFTAKINKQFNLDN